MQIPQTLLSFIYHSTIPNYRDEIHYDIDAAIRRFGLTDSAFATLSNAAPAGALPSANAVANVAKALELGAFDLRKSNGNNVAGMTNSTQGLIIGHLPPLLAAELAGGGAAPDQLSVGPPSSLISDLYHLVYSASYRANASPSTEFDAAAWNQVKAAVNARNGSFSVLLPPITSLCGAISTQFLDSLWPIVW